MIDNGALESEHGASGVTVSDTPASSTAGFDDGDCASSWYVFLLHREWVPPPIQKKEKEGSSICQPRLENNYSRD